MQWSQMPKRRVAASRKRNSIMAVDETSKNYKLTFLPMMIRFDF